jgi:hypothetical protein
LECSKPRPLSFARAYIAISVRGVVAARLTFPVT